MPTYTVHAPPARNGARASDRFLFVRDGFHAWAFIAPSLWLLAYRQWLALVIYLVATAAFVGLLLWLGIGTSAIVAAALCISLLLGFEAATVRRWTLARRGWTTLGFVVGEDADEAERRFFVRWSERTASAPAITPASSTLLRRASSGVIGLFPEPDGAR